jgi:hypothetical protein
LAFSVTPKKTSVGTANTFSLLSVIESRNPIPNDDVKFQRQEANPNQKKGLQSRDRSDNTLQSPNNEPDCHDDPPGEMRRKSDGNLRLPSTFAGSGEIQAAPPSVPAGIGGGSSVSGV